MPLFTVEYLRNGTREVIIIIIRRLITCAMSEYMTESEVRTVARWEVWLCLRMVHKTKQVCFEPVFESLQHFLWWLGFHSKSWGHSS